MTRREGMMLEFVTICDKNNYDSSACADWYPCSGLHFNSQWLDYNYFKKYFLTNILRGQSNV